MTNKCPIAIFFNDHSDYATTRVLKTSLKDLQTLGYKVFLWEFAAGYKLTELIMNYEHVIPLMYQYLLEQTNGDVFFAKNLVQREQSTYELLKEIHYINMTFFCIDSPTIRNDSNKSGQTVRGELNDERDEFMIKRINKICAEENTGLLLPLGANHFGILENLKHEGYSDIKTFYIFSRDPLSDKKFSVPNIARLITSDPNWRNSNGFKDITLIDLRDYSDVSAVVEEVKCQISGECLNSHDEV